MEPWQNEPERAAWCQALVPLGLSPDQAEVARLVRHGYRNEQVAALQRRSLSAVKVDVRILFAVLHVSERDRHAMGRAAQQAVERAAPGDVQTSKPRVPLPELKLVKKRVSPRRRRGDAAAHDGAPEA